MSLQIKIGSSVRLAVLLMVASGIPTGAAAAIDGPKASPPSPSKTIEFNRDIRPVLADNCFHCHGFDAGKRKGNLRLDTAEGATALHDGRQAVKPGDPSGSELIRRVRSADPATVMPPQEAHKRLAEDQIERLVKWITEGAEYQPHWSFIPPQRPGIPPTKHPEWARNEVDAFVLAAIEGRGWKPSSPASRETLVRRLALDLTGLPPTPGEVDEFLKDQRPEAYELLVDRLLASPRFGEHMARYWLDAARYGDTHGLHLDNERSMWAYRDWVVNAFNQNLPFDQFTIWQLAGDLLPQPTREQLVASGFNRCNVTTSEGGAIDEEFQVRYAVDRVETTSAIWMGLTMGCAVCHDHKLDPVTQKEFYQVSTIFNNLTEKPMDGNALLPPPTLLLPNPEQEKTLAEMSAKISDLETQLRDTAANLEYSDPATLTPPPPATSRETVWVDDDFPQGVTPAVNDGNSPGEWITAEQGPVQSGKRSLRRTGEGVHQTYYVDAAHPVIVGSGDRLFAYVYLDPAKPPKAIMLQYHLDGWSKRANWGDPEAIAYGAKNTPEKLLMGDLPTPGQWVKLEVEAARLDLKPGAKITGVAFTQFGGTAYWDKAGVLSQDDPAKDPIQSQLVWEKAEQAKGNDSSAPKEIKELLAKETAKRTPEDLLALKKHYLRHVYAPPGSPIAGFRQQLASTRSQREAFEKDIPATLISRELERPRPAWVLLRGAYDKHGEEVGPGVPAVLPPLPQGDITNRLSFARWLVDPRHPLTARVTVNRFWQQFFGTGLVKTAEDFGAKGEWPSHPELLDWLATEFICTHWDMKGFVRLLVTSATYRQDSRVTPELAAADPENRWLARGPRHRLDAEVLRDSALYSSGLLNLKMGGRGVRPYQPGGIWEAVGYTTSNTAKYQQDTGEALYRRSLYTFWKRTAPPPSMTTFDAPSREMCRVRRERTNTPLQALLAMNDPQYFEAARHLGYRMWREGGASDAERLAYGFRLVTARVPADGERSVLAEALKAQRSRYDADAEAARKAIGVGESSTPSDVPAPELAAYTMVANLLLNLDAAVTKN